MFNDTLTLKTKANVDRTYIKRRNMLDGTERIDSASTQSEPCLMVIKHSVQGSGPAAIDRHLVQFSRTSINSVTGKSVTSTVNLTIAVPRDSTISASDVEDDLVALLRFVCGTDFQPSGSGSDYASTVFNSLVLGES